EVAPVELEAVEGVVRLVGHEAAGRRNEQAEGGEGGDQERRDGGRPAVRAVEFRGGRGHASHPGGPLSGAGASWGGVRRDARRYGGRMSTVPPGRAALQRHVLEVQRTIRTCTGCGLCCTAAHNTMTILPLEAGRIVAPLRRLPAPRREALLARARAAVARWRLARAGGLRHYTCSFLEPDMSCALPLHVKPVACLSFNPLTPDACDQEPEWLERAGAEVAADNRRAGRPARRRPIPAAVLKAAEARPSHGSPEPRPR